MNKLTCYSLLGALIIPSFTLAGSTALGGVFTDGGSGTRPQGMGGAFVAVADDANAVQEGAAGMAFFERGTRFVTFTHSNLYGLGALSREYISFAQADVAGFGAFGLAWNRLSANLDPEQWNEDAYAYAGAKKISAGEEYPKLAVGWNAKYFRVDSGLSDLGDGLTVNGGSASGYGFGLSVMLKVRPSLAFAIAAQDLYSSLSWATGTLEIVPTTAKAGFSYRLTEQTLFAAEARGRQGSSGFVPSSAHLGAEFWLFDGKQLMWNAFRNVGARAGYLQQFANNDGGNFTAGASAKADQWQIDYAYQMGFAATQLEATHRFGLGMNF